MNQSITPWRLFSMSVAVLIPPASSAAGGNFWLDVNLGSMHSEKGYMWQGRTDRFNQTNFGLGATYQLKSWCDIKAGWFDNSYDKTSLYALVNPKWELLPRGRWSLAPGVAAGVVTGYRNTPEQTDAVAPWGMITLSIGLNDRWRVNLGYIPSRLFVSNSIDVATLQVSIKL